jgi:hypothetical protein
MLKYLRFATYSLLIAALWTAGRRLQVIPLSLNSPTSIAADAARLANKSLTEDADIFDCARSGKEIFAIGERTLAEHHLEGVCVPIPRVKIQSREYKVSWVLSYDWPDAPPGSPYVLRIVVDDATGAARIE